MAVKPKPIGPRLLVKQLDPEETNVGGIILPKEATEMEQRGVVIASGRWYSGFDEDEIEEKELPVKVGEVVIWRQGTGTKVRLDLSERGISEELIVLDMTEVLLVLEDVRARVEA